MVLHHTKKCFLDVGTFEVANYLFAFVDDGVSFESANCPIVLVVLG